MGLFRLLLALSVATSHFGGPYLIFNSRYAVQVFYIVSGFLISMIIQTKYKGHTWLFYSNRALRIFAPYWTVWVPTLVLTLIYKNFLGGGYYDNLYKILSNAPTFNISTSIYVCVTNIIIFGQDLGMFLGYSPTKQLYLTSAFQKSEIPVWQFQLIPQAWTISVELCFYLIAPFLLRRPTIVLILILLISFLMRGLAYQHGLNQDPWTYRFFPFELAYFILGGLTFRFSQFVILSHSHSRLSKGLSWVCTLTALSVLVAWSRWTGLLASWTVSGQPVILFLFCASCLPSLLKFSSYYSWDRWLGTLSYPVYLVHMSVSELLGTWIPLQIGSLNMSAAKPWVQLALTLIAAGLISFGVERPLDRVRARRLQKIVSIPSV